MINKVNQVLNKKRNSGGRDSSRRRNTSSRPFPVKKNPESSEQRKGGSETWVPFASYCTTGQFTRLQGGFKRHCSPTAVVNIVRTLENGRKADHSPQTRTGTGPECKTSPQEKYTHKGKNDLQKKRSSDADNSPEMTSEEMFLRFAQIGKRMHVYWNKDLLGRFGGTSNFLTGIYLRGCLRAVGLGKDVSVRFHPWITPDAVEKALEQGAIVLLQVYHHPKYKNHHMLCYACRRPDREQDPAEQEHKSGRQFLLADGWSPVPLWVDETYLGHGHFLTIKPE